MPEFPKKRPVEVKVAYSDGSEINFLIEGAANADRKFKIAALIKEVEEEAELLRRRFAQRTGKH